MKYHKGLADDYPYDIFDFTEASELLGSAHIIGSAFLVKNGILWILDL